MAKPKGKPSSDLLTQAALLLEAEAEITRASCEGITRDWACDCKRDADGQCNASRTYKKMATTAAALRRFT